jgi:zinc transport system substrate-binding protein
VGAAALLVSAPLAGCDAPGSAAANGRAPVVAAFYPLQFVAERVGGDAVHVSNLVKPGAEPHDLELAAGEIRAIADAKLVVYLRGFQPQVDDAVAQQGEGTAFDVGTVEPLREAPAGTEPEPGESDTLAGKDPHVWLDPVRLAAIGDALAARLATVDAARAADYRGRAAALRTDLETLDREYADGLRSCPRREIVTSHAAFGYLAARYGLTQIAVTGLSPEEEPSAQRLAAVAERARARGATTIFFETLVSPKLAETLAREVGAKAEVLDPIEGLQPGSTEDYTTVMRSNLGRLRSALGCA